MALTGPAPTHALQGWHLAGVTQLGDQHSAPHHQAAARQGASRPAVLPHFQVTKPQRHTQRIHCSPSLGSRCLVLSAYPHHPQAGLAAIQGRLQGSKHELHLLSFDVPACGRSGHQGHQGPLPLTPNTKNYYLTYTKSCLAQSYGSDRTNKPSHSQPALGRLEAAPLNGRTNSALCALTAASRLLEERLLMLLIRTPWTRGSRLHRR